MVGQLQPMELIMTTQSLVTFSKRRYSRSGILLGTIDCSSGMAFISSDIYPKWKGNLLVGSLKFPICRNAYLQETKLLVDKKLLQMLGVCVAFCKVLMATLLVVEGKGIKK
jgi:hypothetical protein